MRQTLFQSAAEFLRHLRRQAMRCDYGSSLYSMLRDQLVVGVYLEDIRRRLLADPKLALQRALDIINVEDQVDKNATYFHQLHGNSSRTREIFQIHSETNGQKKLVQQHYNRKRVSYRCGGLHKN